MSKLIIPKTTTAYREAAVPKAADLLYDTEQNRAYIGDGVTPGGILLGVSGGTTSDEVTAGFGISVVDNEVSLKRFDAIESLVSGGTVQAGHAYKLNATSSSGTTIYAEWFANGTFARDPAHIEIMVNGVGYLHLGQNTTAGSETAPFVLVGALEPDAMNNVTVRFHDGVAVMTVEDHIGGYVVISGGTSQSTAGTLPYALVNTGSDASPYITFSSELNGTTFDVTGVTVTTERHVVGNGYDKTKITGDVNVGTSGTLTMAAVGLQNVVVSSGTMTLGDVYIPSGATVAVSGGGLAIEKVSGNGGVIDLGETHIELSANASFFGIQVVSGSAPTSGDVFGGAVYQYNGSTTYTDCTFMNNHAITGGGLSFASSTTAVLSNCIVSANSASVGNGGGLYFVGDSVSGNIIDSLITQNVTAPTARGAGIFVANGATVELTGTTVLANSGSQDIYVQSASVKLTGNNKIGKLEGSSGTVALTSGAIVDLTGNTNATPIAPGGGITFESGGATVKVGDSTASSSYMMDNVTLPAGAKLTNTAVVNLNSSNIVISFDKTVFASGCTFTGGYSTSQGGAFYTTGQLELHNCIFSGNTAAGAGRSIAVMNGVTTLVSCSFAHGESMASEYIFATNSGALICSSSDLSAVQLQNSATRIELNGQCDVMGIVGQNGTPSGGGAVIISSGASINLTSSIATGGGIQVVGGTCTVNGNVIESGTYTSIDSNGSATV